MKSVIQVVKNTLSHFESRYRNIEDSNILWNTIYDDLWKFYGNDNSSPLDTIDKYISYSPCNDEKDICFCDNKTYINRTHFHITNKPCEEATYCYCIDCNTLEIKKHKVGNCPHSQYFIKD